MEELEKFLKNITVTCVPTRHDGRKLYPKTGNRQHKLTLSNGTKRVSFPVYSGLGWNTYDTEHALHFLFDEASHAYYYSDFSQFCSETDYDKQLGRATARVWYQFSCTLYKKLQTILTEECIEEIMQCL